MFTLTQEDVRACFNAKADKIQEFYPYLQETCLKYQINTPARVAAFFAQIAIESLDLTYTCECATGDTYSHRKDLGNTLPEAIAAYNKAVINGFEGTIGAFYKGHGLMQTTGYYNHCKLGEALGIDLVNHPELLETPEWACKSAGWFWSTKNLNSFADVGEFGKITYIINGGYNEAELRLKRFIANKKILGTV